MKTKSTFSSPCGRGAAVFETAPKTTDAVRGQSYPVEKNKNRKDMNMKTISSIYP